MSKRQYVKMVKCRCGRLMVENDGHWICEKYLRDIQNGVQEQIEIIEELENANKGY